MFFGTRSQDFICSLVQGSRVFIYSLVKGARISNCSLVQVVRKQICTILLLFISFFFPRQDNVEGKCGSWYNETYLGKTSLLIIPRKTFIDK
jgi:hypothetical protein